MQYVLLMSAMTSRAPCSRSSTPRCVRSARSGPREGGGTQQIDCGFLDALVQLALLHLADGVDIIANSSNIYGAVFTRLGTSTMMADAMLALVQRHGGSFER